VYAILIPPMFMLIYILLSHYYVPSFDEVEIAVNRFEIYVLPGTGVIPL
jgi:hypothetical protein